jgi:poly-gamma-glutamate synthesis protein (capsule biosynthesis protein)
VPLPDSATLLFTGDVLTHRGVNRAAATSDGGYDYRAMFGPITATVSAADVAICHLEAPVAPPGEDVMIAPMRVSSAASMADALAAAGFDRCSTASNHSMDRGTAGIDATVGALEAAGIGQSGMARTPEEAQAPVLTVNGIRFAHLAYTFSFNGLQAPAGEPWRANLIDPDRIVADAADARARGAEAVIVSLHWGVERGVQPTTEQRRVADIVAASGQVDLIVGHHAHVLQPISQEHGVWVAWGLGNVLSDHPTSSKWPLQSMDAVLLHVTLTRAADGTIDVGRPVAVPTWCDSRNGNVIHLTSEADQPGVDPGLAESLRASHARTVELLGDFVGSA